MGLNGCPVPERLGRNTQLWLQAYTASAQNSATLGTLVLFPQAAEDAGLSDPAARRTTFSPDDSALPGTLFQVKVASQAGGVTSADSDPILVALGLRL